MAALPGIPDRVVTSTPGQSPITPGAIQGPFAMLAKTLDDTSGSVDNLAVKAAEDAGPKAVTQDADGNLSVQQVGPLSGRAGEVFNRSAKLSYLTRLSQQVQDDVLANRVKFDGQPDSFKDWGTGYTDQIVANASEEMRPAVQRLVAAHVAENYQSLALQRKNLDTQSALTNFKSQIVTNDNRMAALARDGGTGTPEYQQALTDTRALYNELGKSPMFNYPQARIDQELGEMESRHQAEAILGQGSGIFDKRGYADAKQFYQQRLWDPKLNLTEAQRAHYTALGMANLEGKTADQQAQIQALRPEVEAHTQLMRKGGGVDPRQTNDLMQRAQALGDAKSVYELASWQAFQPTIQLFNQSTDSQRVEIMRGLESKGTGTVGAFNDWVGRKVEKGTLGSQGPLSDQAGGIRSAIGEEAKRQGLDPKLAQTVGFLESGFDPNKKPLGPDGKPLSDAFGIFNFIPATAARYGIAPGASPEDQIRAGVSELKEIHDTLKTKFGREPTAAEVYTAHYQGLGGANVIFGADPNADLKTTLDSARPGWTSKDGKTWGEVVMTANPWLQKVGSDQPFNPYLSTVRAKIIDDARTKLSTRLDGTVDEMIEGMRKRQGVSPEEIGNVVDWVQATGNFDAGRKLADFIGAKENADLTAGMPEDKRAALISSLTVKAADGSNRADRLALNLIRQTNDQAKEGMQKDPLTEIGVRGWASAPKAIDWQNPANAGAEFANRQRSIDAARARDNTLGPMPVLTTGEQGALKAALTTGDVKTGAAILDSIRQNASPDNWLATMMTPQVKDSLDAAARSYDPQRLNLAMSTLDQLQRADPLRFKEVYGENSNARLQTWQAFKDSLSPQEMAEKFKQVDDPTVREARGKLTAEAKTKLGSVTPDDVAYQMGNAWPVTPGIVARNLTGTQAAGPVDPVQGVALVADYENQVAQRYAEIGDIDKAKQQAAKNLATRWGASPDVAKNSLMLYPPERFYPQFAGSHDWMKDALTKDVAKYVEQRRGGQLETYNVEPSLTTDFTKPEREPGQMLPSGYSYRVTSDPQTEAEIKNGQPPSYSVTVIDDKGVADFVRDDQNRVLRYRWDTGPAREAAEHKFNEARTQGMPQPFRIGGGILP